MDSQRPSFNHFPLFILASAFAAGILCARFIPLALALGCGVAAALVSLSTFVRRRLGSASLFAVLAFTCAGAILSIEEREGVARNRVRRFYDEGHIASGEPVELTGAMERAPEQAPDGLFISLRVESLSFKGEARAARGRVELFAPARDASARRDYDALELRRGARLRVLVALTRADRFSNPGVSSLTEFLDGRDLDARGTIKSPLLVERLDDERVLLPLVWLDVWRARLIESANRLLSAETAGVFNAAMLGNRHGLTKASAESFRDGGTFHVLVISGLHVTFVGGLVWAVARRLTRRRALQWAVSTACVWLYSTGVGAEVSVVRAALMFTLVALAPVVARRSDGINALGAAALALLAWRPANLFDPSFQLTFLSVLAIVALAWPLLSRLKETGEWRPTQGTPYPPVAAGCWLALGEILFWRERRWKRELAHSTHRYRLFKAPLAARLDRWRLQGLLRYVFAAAFVSACVQVCLLPALVLYFHRLSVASLLLNVWIGVMMVVLSFSALAAMLSAQIGGGPAAAPFVWLAETSNRLMTESVHPFAALGLAGARLPEYAGASSLIYALYFLPLVTLAVSLARWHPVSPRHRAFAEKTSPRARRVVKLAAAAQACLLLLIVLHPLSAGRPDGRLRVDFLDVGQGDAALLTMPDGTTLLVDGGGRPNFSRRVGSDGEAEGEVFERDARSIGERVVSEYLWGRGLWKIDYVLATHADADHLDGLNDVAKNFRVGAALVARTPRADPEFARFAETAERERVPIYLVGRGDTLRFGAATVEVLWPPPAGQAPDAPSANDDSIVLRVRFGHKTFLLAGDIEARAEAALVAAQGHPTDGPHADLRSDLRCDVLKVAHHGSRTSSTAAFVGATRPTLAIISAGLDSPFGHPHREVSARWLAAGARLLTTGEAGTITLSTDGRDLLVETYKEVNSKW
jgi:competence protein ComEC